MDAPRADAAPDGLVGEFTLARLDLAAAVAAQRRRDTPDARREVAECLEDRRIALLGRRQRRLAGRRHVFGDRIPRLRICWRG